MMRIVFDATTVHQSESGSITAVIYFDFGTDQQFPVAGWNDFVVVVVNWWLTALEQIALEHGEAELRFMDGPYWITAVVQGQNLLLRCIEDRPGAGALYETIAGVEEVKGALMTVARQLSSACARLNIQSQDLRELRKRLPN